MTDRIPARACIQPGALASVFTNSARDPPFLLLLLWRAPWIDLDPPFDRGPVALPVAWLGVRPRGYFCRGHLVGYCCGRLLRTRVGFSSVERGADARRWCAAFPAAASAQPRAWGRCGGRGPGHFETRRARPGAAAHDSGGGPKPMDGAGSRWLAVAAAAACVAAVPSDLATPNDGAVAAYLLACSHSGCGSQVRGQGHGRPGAGRSKSIGWSEACGRVERAAGGAP